MPEQVYERLGLLRLIPQSAIPIMLDPAVLQGIKLTLILSLILALAGPLRRSASVLACLLLIFYQGLVRGLTYTQHAELSLLYAALILTLFSLADAVNQRRGLSVKPGVNLHAVPIQTLMILMCLSYSFIGLFRLGAGGMELLTSDTLKYWIVKNSIYPNSDTSFRIGLLTLDYPGIPTLLNGGFILTTVFEVLAPLCLVYTAFRRVWLVVMLGFHANVLLLMNISFWENCLLYLVFVNYHPWVSRQRYDQVLSMFAKRKLGSSP